MANQFLDRNGLDKVAEKVNTRLKTVTEMPVTANEGAVRLYVGETAGGYTKGHTYQYQTDSWVDITPAGGAVSAFPTALAIATASAFAMAFMFAPAS